MNPDKCGFEFAVFKFVEPPENSERPLDQSSRVKFKIISLKVKGDQLDYIPELVNLIFVFFNLLCLCKYG